MPKLPKDLIIQDNVIVITVDNYEVGKDKPDSKNDLYLAGNPDLIAQALGIYACRHEVVADILRKAVIILDAGRNQKLN